MVNYLAEYIVSIVKRNLFQLMASIYISKNVSFRHTQEHNGRMILFMKSSKKKDANYLQLQKKLKIYVQKIQIC